MTLQSSIFQKTRRASLRNGMSDREGYEADSRQRIQSARTSDEQGTDVGECRRDYAAEERTPLNARNCIEERYE